MDIDLVCELADGDISQLIRLIGTDYYASETAMRDAVRRKECFNLIHLPTSFKVDVFVSRGRPFDVESMKRAPMQRLGAARFVELPIATAEDSIISKLERYRLTNEPRSASGTMFQGFLIYWEKTSIAIIFAGLPSQSALKTCWLAFRMPTQKNDWNSRLGASPGPSKHAHLGKHFQHVQGVVSQPYWLL